MPLGGAVPDDYRFEEAIGAGPHVRFSEFFGPEPPSSRSRPLTACGGLPGLTAYVDHLFAVGDWGRWTGGGHLQADTRDELHEFANRIGLRREWFQARPGRPENDHYDLTRAGRDRALELGAIAEDRTAGVRRRQAIRQARRASRVPAAPDRTGQPAERS